MWAFGRGLCSQVFDKFCGTLAASNELGFFPYVRPIFCPANGTLRRGVS